MHVLQFAFSENMKNPQRATQTSPNTVVYTGTHDNPTTRQWWRQASPGERERVLGAGRDAASSPSIQSGR